MKKKIYATPDLSVVEFKVSEIVCTSVDKDQNNVGIKETILPGTSDNPSRSNSRNGIWDED